MATAVALPRMKYAKAARLAWLEWKRKGNEPTLDTATTIVRRELGNLSLPGLGEEFARSEKSGVLDSGLSFLVWDLTENGRGALDYDEQIGFVKNLLAQARDIISGSYARESISIGKHKFTVPTTISIRGKGASDIAEDATADDREEWADGIIRQARVAILRAHTIKGADWKFVRRTLLRAYREVRAAWKATAISDSIAAD